MYKKIFIYFIVLLCLLCVNCFAQSRILFRINDEPIDTHKEFQLYYILENDNMIFMPQMKKDSVCHMDFSDKKDSMFYVVLQVDNEFYLLGQTYGFFIIQMNDYITIDFYKHLFRYKICTTGIPKHSVTEIEFHCKNKYLRQSRCLVEYARKNKF